MLFYFSLGVLILILGAQIFLRLFVNNRSGITRISTPILKRFDLLKLKLVNIWEVEPPSAKLFKYFLIISIFIVFILLFYQSWQQYQSWSQNEVSKFLLPPYQTINCFIFYAASRIFAPYLISLIAAILFLFSAKALNKKYQERFFYPEEPYFGALAIFLTGHPGWIFYGIAVILIYLLIHLFLLIYYKLCSLTIERSNRLERKPLRISLRYVWLPAAIFVIIIINYWLQTLGWWNLLRI